jgi:putative SOS response-associated peptidase YedK
MTLTTAELAEVAEMLEAELPPEASSLYRPRYNVAPTDQHWIARPVGDHRELQPAHWGFVLDGRPLVINARGETAHARFRDAWRSRRCVVPADGFYEWKGEKSARRPIWFHRPDGQLLLMAGLYDDRDEAGHLTFTVLTRPANEVVAGIHDRMPLLIPRERVADWLAGKWAELGGSPVPLVGKSVSARANSVKNDDPACLEEEAAPPQLGLFPDGK